MMTQADKLQVLIQRAIDGGWTDKPGSGNSKKLPIVYTKEGEPNLDATELIYNHGFARALFGREMIAKKYSMCEHSKPAWQYYLQQAVIADDPIDYLYNAIL